MSESKFTPGPWVVAPRAISVGCENDKLGGYAKLFDVRGWGYLTGNGHGGLGLDHETAYEIQKANARLIAAAPDLLEALRPFAAQAGNAQWWNGNTVNREHLEAALVAVSKAIGEDR